MHDSYPSAPSPGEPQSTAEYRDCGTVPQNAVPQNIGRYRVQRILGKGGFGLVYLAYDDKLQRSVAIKIPHAELVTEVADAEAYLTEARTVANLDHPHIVPVYDVGSTEQFPCFVVSKYIDGSDLFTRLKRSRLPSDQAVQLVVTVAEALHYAHKQEIVHRDVKPNNILLDKTGKPFVADFGLALRERDVGKGPRYAGTPAYMSPEQARGEGHRVDGRSDIFSLGVVFYELLTGKRPFKGESTAEIFEQVTTFEPRPPRQLDDDVPKELERICLKALSKRASERYSTAKDMADDLRHWLDSPEAGRGPAKREGQAVVEPELAAAPGLRGEGVTPSPTTTPPVPPSSDSQPIRIVPKGLRSFDAHDADFFLELLPGPRDRDGLPDSIRFWKTRIEETDVDNTFAVGLIYGPSGCGKSSLVKAGLLPRLSADVIAVYVEATADETETRLLNGLRKRCHFLRDNLGLPDNLGLKETLSALRRGQGLPEGKKVLIVLDQFEQWLHAKQEQQNTELVQALRQCDGGRVQCVVTVRDDFWLAVSRFLRELEIRLVEGRNSALADLFDLDHARKVLSAFGRAYGKLPLKPGETSQDEKEFLSQSVSGLAQEGKVISVRLALFAEMMKGKAWMPASLRAVGGTEGVGGTFLEETFSAATAPPEHRYHQKAARAVLKALLPESGTDIKGHMRPYAELLEASGYGNRPNEFDDLIRILDGEIRLITPTDPEVKDEAGASTLRAGERYYQLTHDYLVHSLREWLARKQRETRRGRAELRLAERAAAFAAKPDPRLLPGWFEWPNILLFTRRRNWTAAQRRVMRAAGRRHGLHVALVALLLAAAAFGGREARRRVNEDHDRVQGNEVVKRLLVAPLAAAPQIAAELAPYRAWTDPELRRVLTPDSGAAADERLRASIGLLDVDPAQAPAICDAMLQASPDEALVLIAALKPRSTDFLERLRRQMADREASPPSRLRAAMAVADYAPPAREGDRWLAEAPALVDQILAEVRQDPGRYEPLVAALEPAKRAFLPALEAVFRDARRNPAERGLVTSMLAKYAAAEIATLVDLIVAAEPEQFLTLFAALEKHGGATRQPLANMANEIPSGGLAQSKRVTMGRRRASAAVALVRQGEFDAALNVLRVTDDTESLTQFVHGARPRGVLPGELLECLERTDRARQALSGEPRKMEDRVLFGLLLALGDFTLGDLPPENHGGLLERLADWHAHDASSAVHGASGWLLRQWGQGELAKQVDESEVAYAPGREWFTLKLVPHQSEASARRSDPEAPAAEGAHEPEAPARKVDGGAENSSLALRVGVADEPPFYLTFVVVPPGKYVLGSPDDEADRQTDERRHAIELRRPFAVSDREVTWAQYSAFDGGSWHDAMEKQFGRKLALDDPAFGANWFDAVNYSRWLTRQAGLADSEQCYADPSALEKDGEGTPKNWPVDVGRHGFRLPTEAEWELACRGGTTTAYSFGNDAELVGRYGWFLDNSSKWSHGVGQLRPNPRGLFDLHGNLWEWCHDWYGDYMDDVVDGVGPQVGLVRVSRGGGWNLGAAYGRTADRSDDRPAVRSYYLGFRLALVPFSEASE